MDYAVPYQEYETLLIERAKTKAVIARLLQTEKAGLGSDNRLKIEKEDGTLQYVSNSEFNLEIPEYEMPNLAPASIDVSRVMVAGATKGTTVVMPESEAVKALEAKIAELYQELLLLRTAAVQGNGFAGNGNGNYSEEDIQNLKNQLEEALNKIATYDRFEEVEYAIRHGGEDYVNLNYSEVEVLEMLKVDPNFVDVIKAHPELFPSMFKDPELLALLKNNPELIDRLKSSPDVAKQTVMIKEEAAKAEELKQEAIINTVLTETAHDIIDESIETLAVMSAASTAATLSAADVVNDRMFEVSTLAGAVAAGDEDEPIKKGAWISGLYGVNKQSTLNNAPGYKGRGSGVTIGFDVGVNDDLIGVAYSNIQSNFKPNKSSGKTQVASHVLSVYGQKDLDHNFSLQGVISGARNYLKNKTTYSGTSVSGKYKSDSVSAEALLNYKYQTNYNLALIPNIGVRYGHVKDGVYNESNIGVQHLSVASKAQNLWTGILGGKVVFAPQKISECVSITPAIHGSIENYFNNKQKKVIAKVTWKDRVVEDTIILPKQPKTGYNIGASVLAQKGNVDVLVEYNCHLQKKYQSHQGFVKLKINF